MVLVPQLGGASAAALAAEAEGKHGTCSPALTLLRLRRMGRMICRVGETTTLVKTLTLRQS